MLSYYRLVIHRGEDDAEGVDNSEWFLHLNDAKKRRKELIEEGDSYIYGENFRIDRVRLRRLPPTELVLAVLNRRAVESAVEIVEAHRPDKYKEAP